MKKFIVAVLAFVYLGVSSGIAMNVHYCMGKVSSIDLTESNDKCHKCGMKKGSGSCCKDELKIIKLSDAHKLISNEVKFTVPVAVVSNNLNIIKEALPYSEVLPAVNNNSPPESSGTSLNILHCVFRI